MKLIGPHIKRLILVGESNDDDDYEQECVLRFKYPARFHIILIIYEGK